MSEVDAGSTLARIALSAASFLAVGSLTLLGLRRFSQRLAELSSRYRGSLAKSADRLAYLADEGFWQGLIARFLLLTRARGWQILAVAGCAVLLLLGAAASGFYVPIYVLVIALVLMPAGGAAVIATFDAKRIARVERTLPQAVSVLASSLGAGVSFRAGLAAAAENDHGPLATELRITCNEMSAGRTPDEALANMAGRVPSPLVATFVAAVRIALQTGGNAVLILKDLSEAISRITHAHQEVRAKTAGARREAAIATCVPFFIVPLVLLIDPDTFSVLFVTVPGRALLGAGIVIWITCAWFMHRVCSHAV